MHCGITLNHGACFLYKETQVELNPIMLKSATGKFIIETIEEFLEHTDITKVPENSVNKLLFIIQEYERVKSNQIKNL